MLHQSGKKKQTPRTHTSTHTFMIKYKQAHREITHTHNISLFLTFRRIRDLALFWELHGELGVDAEGRQHLGVHQGAEAFQVGLG